MFYMHSFKQRFIFSFLQSLSSYITRNCKSTNSQRFYCQSFTPLCSVWHKSCRFCAWGEFPLETPPPSGRAPSPPTDSVSQRLLILLEKKVDKRQSKGKIFMFRIKIGVLWKSSSVMFDLTKKLSTVLQQSRWSALVGNPLKQDSFLKIRVWVNWGDWRRLKYMIIVLLLQLHTGWVPVHSWFLQKSFFLSICILNQNCITFHLQSPCLQIHFESKVRGLDFLHRHNTLKKLLKPLLQQRLTWPRASIRWSAVINEWHCSLSHTLKMCIFSVFLSHLFCVSWVLPIFPFSFLSV